jgi:pyruvate dehydrogenase (quinone)
MSQICIAENLVETLVAAGVKRVFGVVGDSLNGILEQIGKRKGIHGIRVEDPAEVRPALVEAFQHDGPALVEAVVNRMELAMPPTIKLDQAIGFNLWALKAVLSGRGSELVDLAETNLFR